MGKRCWETANPLMQSYHDKEWGTPCHDDRKLFEFLALEGAQAGLSWKTILDKRENYRAAFHNFEIGKVAKMSEKDEAALLTNPGIIRNRLKIKAFIRNAQEIEKMQKEWGSLDAYFWHFVNGKPLQPNMQSFTEMPAQTALSQEISKDLKKRGFKFVGPTIIYAFMQAVGMVNDHLRGCDQHVKLGGSIYD